MKKLEKLNIPPVFKIFQKHTNSTDIFENSGLSKKGLLEKIGKPLSHIPKVGSGYIRAAIRKNKKGINI